MGPSRALPTSISQQHLKLFLVSDVVTLIGHSERWTALVQQRRDAVAFFH